MKLGDKRFWSNDKEMVISYIKLKAAYKIIKYLTKIGINFFFNYKTKCLVG